MRRAFPDFGYDIRAQHSQLELPGRELYPHYLGVFTNFVITPASRRLARPQVGGVFTYSNNVQSHTEILFGIQQGYHDEGGAVFIDRQLERVGVHISQEANGEVFLDAWIGEGGGTVLQMSPDVQRTSAVIILGAARIALEGFGCGPDDTPISVENSFWCQEETSSVRHRQQIDAINYLDLHETLKPNLLVN